MKWYQLDEIEVFKMLQTSEEGLSEAQAKKNLETYGPNKLPEGAGISRLKIILHQFTSPLSNPFLFYSMIAAILAQIAVVYVPALQWVFRTESLTGAEWIQIGLVALTVVLAVEMDKLIRRKRAERIMRSTLLDKENER